MSNFEFLLVLADKLKNTEIPQELFNDAYGANEWFDKENIKSSLEAIVDGMLQREVLDKFAGMYTFSDQSNTKVALILAGNIPFVGCADVIYCALCSVETYIKYASKDSVTMRWLVKMLSSCNPQWGVYEYNGERVDKVIATGSDNSNRYFQYNFENIPSIMRGSRSSMAIISGDESNEELLALWSDIFLRYGQGCRNVSMIFVPHGYNREILWRAWRDMNVDNTHFKNNYRQQKALLTMQKEPFYDGGYFTAIDKKSLQANTSQINIATYSDISEVANFIEENKNLLQCVVSKNKRDIPFGKAQAPELWDYADNKDVINFLLDTI